MCTRYTYYTIRACLIDYGWPPPALPSDHCHCTGPMDHSLGHYQLHSGSGHGQAQVAGEVRGIATEGEGVAMGDMYSSHNIIVNSYKP